MTEQEAKIIRAKHDVRVAEIVFQAAKESMDNGILEAKAQFDAKCAALKKEWLIACENLESSKVWVKEFEDVVGGSH